MNDSSTQSTVTQVCSDRIADFVKRMERMYMLDCPRRFGIERRTVQRLSLTMPVVIRPLDDDLQPLGYVLRGITHDLSDKGAGIVTTDPVGHSHVLLVFEPLNGDSFEVIGRVIYCNDLGYYFQSGYEFLNVPVKSGH